MNAHKTKEFLIRYEKMSHDIKAFKEQSLLAELKSFFLWRELSPKEKHEKRRFVLSVIRKTGNAEEFIVETTIIELYELVESLLERLQKENEQDYKTRLEAMLGIFMFHVNEQRDTRQMDTSSFQYIVNIARECLENNIFIELTEELKRMIALFEKLEGLMS